MKIYTRTGDKGETSLLGGRRVSKSDLRIEAYGTIDELNAHLGLLRDHDLLPDLKERILNIQNELFDIGAYLSCVGDPSKFRIEMIGEDQIKRLETEIDDMEKHLKPLKNFILPGGHIIVSQCHVARCVCRRAERDVIRLNEIEPVNKEVIRYLNRLSDYLFMLARKTGHDLKIEEVVWRPR